MIKNIKKILACCLIFIQFLSLFNVAFAEISTNIVVENKVTESSTNPREFTITYDITVTGETNKKPIDVVLCLDRSGSMLFRDENNILIVDSVKAAADNFVTKFFADYPNGSLAIVSFDSNANAHDNWKYYDNARDAKNEIEFSYSYKPSKGNDPCPYVWSHWKRQSATNIGEAFAYSKRTVEKKKNSNNDNLIILFTDGVANTYSKGNGVKQFTGDYPTTHNASTEYAYDMGIEAQQVADVITVGYFGALRNSEKYETLEIARDTLQRSQNRGFYEAEATDDIYGVFEQVFEDLSCIGKNAKVTEVVEKEFEVIKGSIQPAPASFTKNANGETVIVWDLGDLNIGNYQVQYSVNVKEDAYPTGQNDVFVNNSIGLEYVDLEGNRQSMELTKTQVDIPPLDDFPKVNLTITHPDIEQGGYLVGDIITVEHGLSYINQEPFDFSSIDVGEYRKILVGTDKSLDEVFAFTDNKFGWSITDQTLKISCYEDETGSIRPLNWDDIISLELECLQEGNYSFNHSIDYTLINEAGNRFEYPICNLVNDEIKVEKGMVSFSLVDEEGTGVEGLSIIINDEEQNVQSTSTGDLVLENLPTGSYTFKIPIPSGYKVNGSNEDVEGSYLVYNIDLNYSNPEFTKIIEFEKLDINNISVTTRDNKDEVFILEDIEEVDAKVTFTVDGNLRNLRLRLTDTFKEDITDENITFTLDSVKKIGNDKTYDFIKDNDEIVYDGTSTLAQGTYEAYIIITSPTNLNNDGYNQYNYNVGVNEISFQGVSDSHEKVEAINSRELTIRLATGPRIQLERGTEDWTTVDTIKVTITSDEAQIIGYQCKLDELPLPASAFDSDYDGDGLKNVEKTDLKVTADFTVYLENSELSNGEFEGNGFYTVYARDEAGNETVRVIKVDNLYDELPFDLT